MPSPRIVRKATHQTGKTHIVQDVQRMALGPGMRVSRHGKPYYEGRKNRSDRSPKKRL
jgi:hypothetical protein